MKQAVVYAIFLSYLLSVQHILCMTSGGSIWRGRRDVQKNYYMNDKQLCDMCRVMVAKCDTFKHRNLDNGDDSVEKEERDDSAKYIKNKMSSEKDYINP